MEPLSVASHALNTLASFKHGQSIAIYGAGPVGLLLMAVARALGARRIFAIDIVPSRLSFAASYAGAETFLPEGKPPQEAEERMEWSRRETGRMMREMGIEMRGERAVDVVVDASGAEVCVQMGLYLVKVGGTYVQVCISPPPIRVWYRLTERAAGRDGRPKRKRPPTPLPRQGAHSEGQLPVRCGGLPAEHLAREEREGGC